MTNVGVLGVAMSTGVAFLLLGLVTLRFRRKVARLAYIALALDAIVMMATYLLLDSSVGVLGPAWNPAALLSFALFHPLITLYILVSMYGKPSMRRHSYLLALFAPAPIVAVLGPSYGPSSVTAYEIPWIGSYLVACLAIGLAEAVAWWRRSAIHRSEAVGAMLATVVAIEMGPGYSFELPLFGVATEPGANPAAPFVLAIFAFVAFRANPMRIPTPMPATGKGRRFPVGRVAFLAEIRPGYSTALARAAAASGQPTIVLQRVGHDPAGPSGERTPTPQEPSRISATVKEFADRYPGGVVVFRDLGDVVCRSGRYAASETVSEAVRLARARRLGLIVSSWGLTAEEVLQLERRLGRVMRLPRPETEIEAMLTRPLGDVGKRILDGFLLTTGRRREDLTPLDAEALVTHLQATFERLGRVAGNSTVKNAWAKEAGAIALNLNRFASLSFEELAQWPWRSTSPTVVDPELVVRASEYWKGREVEEAAQTTAGAARLGETVRTAFLESLGPAGVHLFEIELQRLRKKAADLTPGDVRAIADGTGRTAADLLAAIDTAVGRAALESRARDLRNRLLALAEV